MKTTKRQDALNLCAELLIELLIGKFGSIKFNDTEKRELTEYIIELRQRINNAPPTELSQLAATLYEGKTYIASESCDLTSIGLGWITSVDLQYLIDQRTK